MFSRRKLFWYFNKICFCIILTLIILITMKINNNFKEQFYKNVYETNISFARINSLYEKYAGSSLPFKDYFLDKTKPVFDETLVYKETSKYLDGVKLTVDIHYLIPCLKDGLVVFVGEKEGYGYTIIIDQLDGVNVWYSNIDESAVSLYDYVNKGQLLGNCEDDYFYLVFKKDGKVLNYEEYI